MKFKKLICLIVAVLMMTALLSSCGSEGVAVMTFRGETLSTNMYSYMLSSQKAYLKEMFDYYNALAYYYYQSYYFGTDDFNEYLASETTDEEGNTITVGSSANDMVLSAAKSLVVINYFFNKYNLEITDTSTVDAIESYLSEDVATAGNKDYLEIMLAKYGANYDIEKTYLYSTANSAALYDYLYGENGTQRLDDSVVKEEFAKSYNKVDVLYYQYYETVDSVSTIVEDSSITDASIKDYFDNNYVKVKQILLYTVDKSTGDALDDSTAAEKATKAQELFDDIKSGNLNFDTAREANNEDTNDDGTIVYKGLLDESIENVEAACLSLEFGEYVLVKSSIGYHILKRIEMEDSDYTDEFKSDIKETLTKEHLNQLANEAFKKAEKGELNFDSYSTEDAASSPDGFGLYSKDIVYTSGELEDSMEEAIEKLSENEVAYLVTDSGAFVLKKLPLDDDDYLERYDDIYDTLAEESYSEYIQSFFSEIEINETELAKYDFLTAEALEIGTLGATEESAE